MRLISVEANSSLEMTLNESDGYSSLTFSARIELGHGTFVAENRDVHFRTLPSFRREVARFIADRSLRPRAEGSYESYIELYGDGRHTFVAFMIGDAYCGREAACFSFTGSFEFESDHLSTLVRELEVLDYDP